MSGQPGRLKTAEAALLLGSTAPHMGRCSLKQGVELKQDLFKGLMKPWLESRPACRLCDKARYSDKSIPFLAKKLKKSPFCFLLNQL